MAQERGLRGVLRRLRNDCKGNVLAMTAMGLPIMVGGAGLGIDTTQWYLWKREIQLAADAAALAGAYSQQQGRSYSTSAKSSLKSNITVASSYTQSVTLGSWKGGTNNAIIVAVSTQRALPFSRLIGIGAPVITASATAAIIDAGEHCLISLNESDRGAVDIGGNALVRLGCGISSNSKHADSFIVDGSALVDASPLTSVGGISAAPKSLEDDTTIRPFSSKQADPLAGLTTPTDGASKTYDFKGKDADLSLDPGTYKGGIDVNAAGTVTMAPGVYTIDGGTLKINGSTTLIGSGVVIVLKNGANIDINGNGTVDLAGPTDAQALSYGLSADFGGVLVYEDKATAGSGVTSLINGNSKLNLAGTIYTPKQEIQLKGNTEPKSKCLFMVGDTINISGSAIIPNTCPAELRPPGDFGAKVVRLVA